MDERIVRAGRIEYVVYCATEESWDNVVLPLQKPWKPSAESIFYYAVHPKVPIPDCLFHRSRRASHN